MKLAKKQYILLNFCFLLNLFLQNGFPFKQPFKMVIMCQKCLCLFFRIEICSVKMEATDDEKEKDEFEQKIEDIELELEIAQ